MEEWAWQIFWEFDQLQQPLIWCAVMNRYFATRDHYGAMLLVCNRHPNRYDSNRPSICCYGAIIPLHFIHCLLSPCIKSHANFYFDFTQAGNQPLAQNLCTHPSTSTRVQFYCDCLFFPYCEWSSVNSTVRFFLLPSFCFWRRRGGIRFFLFIDCLIWHRPKVKFL